MGLVWKVAVNDLKFMLKEREAQVWMFLMPLGFCLFFGFAFQERGRGPSKPTMAYASQDTSFASMAFRAELDSLGYNVVEVNDEQELQQYRRQLHVPENFTESIVNGVQSTVVLKHDLGDLSAQSDQVKVQRAVWRLLGATAVAAAGDSLDERGLMAAVDTENPLKLDVSISGRKKIIPSGFGQAVPGNLVMFVLLIAFTSGAINLVIERDQGLLRRLASSPLSGAQLLAGKALSRLMICVIEIVYFLLAGALIFKLDWGDNLAALLMVLLAYAFGAAGLGLLMGSLGKSPDQAAGVGILSALVMSALGGAWWPIEIVPSAIRWIAFVFPTGWAMDGMLKAMTLGQTVSSLAPNALMLLLYGIVSIAVASRIFRFS
jgi:ABC-2 type transport system permease protein